MRWAASVTTTSTELRSQHPEGGGGNDNILGSTGNDWLYGGAGNDFMAGGSGDDEYGVGSAGDVIFELPDEGIDRVNAYVDHTLGDNVENLSLKDGSATDGIGNDLDNEIVGNSNDNTLSRLAGNDELYGYEGTPCMATRTTITWPVAPARITSTAAPAMMI